jgi:hypothetical protein
MDSQTTQTTADEDCHPRHPSEDDRRLEHGDAAAFAAPFTDDADFIAFRERT